MQTKPTVSELLNQVPDRYEMILTVSKRARELEAGSEKMTRFTHENPITVAAHEVSEGFVKPTKMRKVSFD